MAPPRRVVHLTTFAKRSSGGLSKSAAVGVAVTFSLIAIIAVVLTTYAYINGWKLPIFQQLGDRVRTTAPRLFDQTRRKFTRGSQRLHSKVEFKSDSKDEQRPGSRPAKYWSAEDISRSKIGTAKSHPPSVMAFPTDSGVLKPPPTPSLNDAVSGYAQSMLSSRTKVSAFMNADGTPQVVRPGSKRVKTWSRHISMQFLPDEVESIPSTTSPAKSEENGHAKEESSISLKELLEQNRRSQNRLALRELEDVTKNQKRNSRAVVTNLDWMQFEALAK